ncbi:MAG: helix-turn-helix domain-containing protein [Solirubrobacterales bacterium]|nr:helix-turn-helix domain-containing protein [Solirubrobacterales bacterium]
MDGDGGLEPLLDALERDREEISERHVRRARAEIPNFAGVPIEEHRRDSTAAVVLLVGMRRAGIGSLPAEARKGLLELGERRARQGVPLEDMLRSWRMGVEEAMGYATEIAPDLGMDSGTVFGFFQQAFDVVDETMVEIARGHRTDAHPDQDRRDALVRGLLMGELPAEEINAGCVVYGLDPLARYTAFRARAPLDRSTTELDEIFGLVPAPGHRIGLAIAFERELIGFTGGEIPRGRLDLVAVGPAVPAVDLAVSHTAAGRVLAAAETFGLAGVQDLAGAGLHAAVIEDVELGQALGEALIEPVREQAAGEEILHTVAAWMAAGMRVEPAAERLFIHPNTVRYRLRRYEELTGADLAVTDEAFRVWWAVNRDIATRP